MDKIPNMFYFRTTVILLFRLFLILCMSEVCLALRSSPSKNSSVTTGLVFESHSNLSFKVNGIRRDDIPKSACSLVCLSTDECIGFQCQGEEGQNQDQGQSQSQEISASCSPCVLTTVASISTMGSYTPSANKLYLAYSESLPATYHQVTTSYYLHLPSGIRESMAFYLQLITGDPTVMFIENKLPHDQNRFFEIDLAVDATFQGGQRPMTILVTSHDGTNQAWHNMGGHIPVEDFLKAPGQKTEWVVFISKSTYSIFIDGKLLNHYQHSRRMALTEFKYLRLVAPSVISLKLFNP